MHISKETISHACLTDILRIDASLAISMDSACSFFGQSFAPPGRPWVLQTPYTRSLMCLRFSSKIQWLT